MLVYRLGVLRVNGVEEVRMFNGLRFIYQLEVSKTKVYECYYLMTAHGNIINNVRRNEVIARAERGETHPTCS